MVLAASFWAAVVTWAYHDFPAISRGHGIYYQKSNKLTAKSKGSIVVFSAAISEGELPPELCGKAAESCTYPQHDPYFLSMPLSIPGM